MSRLVRYYPDTHKIRNCFQEYINSEKPLYLHKDLLNFMEKLHHTDINSFINKSNNFSLKKNISKSVIKRRYNTTIKRSYTKLAYLGKWIISEYRYHLRIDKKSLNKYKKEGLISYDVFITLKKIDNHHHIVMKNESTGDELIMCTTSINKLHVNKKADNQCVQELSHCGTLLDTTNFCDYNTKHVLWGIGIDKKEYDKLNIKIVPSKKLTKIDKNNLKSQIEVGQKYFKKTDINQVEVGKFPFINLSEIVFSEENLAADKLIEQHFIDLINVECNDNIE